ncbi:MAG: serine hydrolase domain-containing protein [Promethearchaeota archaeon]
MDLDEKIPFIEKIVTDGFESQGLPGLAVAIIKDNELKWFKGLGKADLKRGISITPETVFRLASISKTFTTVRLMQLWEKGEFNLDDPVNRFLPNGKVIIKRGWREVTFRDLLTHRSGIGELIQKRDIFKPGFGLFITGRDKQIPPLSTLHDKNIRPEVSPGSKFAYSNIGFSFLGYLIERISGQKSFRDCIKDHVFDPLGMYHSDFIRSQVIKNKEAVGYKYSLMKKLVPSSYPNNIIMPAGNLYSSINDMMIFANCLLNLGSWAGKQILKEETVKLMWTPQYWSHDALKEESSIGLCFHLYNANGFKIVEHSGATSGFTSVFTLVPEEKMAVLVFSNLEAIFGSRTPIIIKNKILQELLGIKENNRDTHVEVRQNILKEIKGYYGPEPGILTNTRIWMTAGDYKVSIKDGKPFLSSFWGSKRKGVELHPTSSDFIFEYDLKPGIAIKRSAIVAFSLDKNQNVRKMHLKFHEFRKNSFFNTLRFKFYLIGVLFVFSLLFTLFFLIF